MEGNEPTESPGLIGSPIRTRAVALLSLAFTYLFFFDYLPPVRHRVRLPFDLPNFHYPFVEYAFQALRQGRFPEWDPTIYSGMPFAANVQAALFYPGTWLVFLASIGRDHVSYQALEDIVFLHVWLAFLLCYLWLARRLSAFAAACGAGVFAYGGYMLLNLQHYGVVAGYAWIPLGMSGIDEFDDTGDWRRLWKAAAASALAFLAGYTPTWVVAVFCFFAYALFRRTGIKTLLFTGGAIIVSLLLVMVQFLPTLDLSVMREAEARYGTGYREPLYFISYLVPNYWDFAFSTNVYANLDRDYLYLGAPGILGLLLVLLLRRCSKTEWSAAPCVLLLAAVAVVVTNAGNVVWRSIEHSALLAQIIRDFYFLAGLSLAAAALAAIGIDRLMRRCRARSDQLPPPVLTYGLIVLLTLWSGGLLYRWHRETLAKGSASILDSAAMVVLFLVGLVLVARSSGRTRSVLAAALLFAAGVDYKASGTHKRFNAGLEDPTRRSADLPNLDRTVYREMQANNVFRVAMDLTAPFPQTLRQYGLTTPQGFDPFLTAAYQKYAAGLGTFRSNWEFDISPLRRDAFDAFGVRYYLSSDAGPNLSALLNSRHFRLMEPANTYYKAFELTDAKPPYGWVHDASPNGIQRLQWLPELREFEADSASGGELYLAEQWHPGWSVRIDGAPARLNRYPRGNSVGPFQSVPVPSGRHRVTFQFADAQLRVGAWISTIALASSVLLFAVSRRRRI